MLTLLMMALTNPAAALPIDDLGRSTQRGVRSAWLYPAVGLGIAIPLGFAWDSGASSVYALGGPILGASSLAMSFSSLASTRSFRSLGVRRPSLAGDLAFGFGGASIATALVAYSMGWWRLLAVSGVTGILGWGLGTVQVIDDRSRYKRLHTDANRPELSVSPTYDWDDKTVGVELEVVW